MAIEYALGLGKPVLFVDVPPRVRNPAWAELGLEPMEMRIRRELGRCSRSMAWGRLRASWRS